METVVTIPWGEWVAPLAGTILTALAAWLGVQLRALLARWGMESMQAQVDAVLGHAVAYGAEMARTRLGGQTASIDARSETVAAALRYAVEHAPKMVRELGGEGAVSQMIVARIGATPAAK